MRFTRSSKKKSFANPGAAQALSKEGVGRSINGMLWDPWRRRWPQEGRRSVAYERANGAFNVSACVREVCAHKGWVASERGWARAKLPLLLYSPALREKLLLQHATTTEKSKRSLWFDNPHPKYQTSCDLHNFVEFISHDVIVKRTSLRRTNCVKDMKISFSVMVLKYKKLTRLKNVSRIFFFYYYLETKFKSN